MSEGLEPRMLLRGYAAGIFPRADSREAGDLFGASVALLRVGGPLATDPANAFVKGAVVYYGSPDTTLRRVDLPILLGRAGLDSPFFNRAIDAMALRALSLKNPLTLAHMRASCAEHWELVAAVENGDPEAAVQAITKHMTRSRGIFLAHMRRDRMRGASVAGLSV